MEGVHSAEAVIDNGEFGVRTIRFETGRLARQAAGSALVTLDGETVVLSATTASKQPKENLDFFPLTVDVEERMYAVGRIPGSFFRREGRPSEDAILTCRLIDRPLRPSFVKGLRNEIQIVATILALDPQHLYDVVAINAASMSTQLAGLPFSGPIGGVRVALIKGQWVGFHGHWTIYKMPGKRQKYVVACDPTKTIEGDPACIQVLNRATMEQVAVWHGSAVASQVGEIALAAAYCYNNALSTPRSRAAAVTSCRCGETPATTTFGSTAGPTSPGARRPCSAGTPPTTRSSGSSPPSRDF